MNLSLLAEKVLLRSPFPRMVNLIKPGKRDTAVVKHIELSANDVMMRNARALRDGELAFVCCPGKYAVLHVNGQLMMSDTALEHQTNAQVWREARGDVLIAGLGLGMVVHGLKAKPEVNSVTVVEINHDVIELVRPSLPKDVLVMHMDIHEYAVLAHDLKREFDTIYLDIWSDICGDDLVEIRKLRLALRKCLRPGGWIGVWADDLRRKHC